MKGFWVFALPVVMVVVWGVAALDHTQEPRPAPPDPPVLPSVVGDSFSPDPADDDACLDCHDDETFTMEKDGREVSIYVSAARYAVSAHREVTCLECHVGFDPDEEPHKENIQPVDCAPCHEAATQSFRRSAHRTELACASCHGDVHVPVNRAAYAPTCRRCHDAAAEDLQASAHAAGEAGPGCMDCHTPHALADVDADRCLSCHGDAAFVREHIDGEDLASVLGYRESIHGDAIACSDCHTGHRVLPPGDAASSVSRNNVAATCAECHDDVAEQYLTSEHGKALLADFAGAPTCTDCHGEHDIHEIADSTARVSRQREVEACLACHLDAPDVRQRMTLSSAFISSYTESIHGRAAEAGNLEAAICSDCHGAHETMKASDPASKVNKFNLAATCGACHQDVETEFAESIHGEALLRGVADAPTCTSCHGEHAIFEHTSAASSVASVNVSEQVCSPCHSSVKLSEKYGFPSDRLTTFGDSYHGLAGRFGSEGVANCASCHGIHDIKPSSDPRSRVHKANLGATCGQCHPGANANFARGTVHIIRTAEGDRLLYWISTIYLILIVVVIGSMGAHNALDWGRKVIDRYRQRLAPPAPAPARRKTNLYVRMTRGERVQHILLATSFMVLVITGFLLKFPDAWWVRGLRNVVGESLFDLRGVLHRVAAVVMILDAVYHVYYVGFTDRGRQFLRDIFPRRSDLAEMFQMLKYNLGLAALRPRFDRFNYIEKAEYWALVWGTVLMTGTGLVLWFENQFMGLYSKLFIDVSETVHYFEAWLAFLAIVVWHFYYVLFNPDVYPMNFTWITGKLTEEEMEKEHPRELERLKQAQSEDVET